MLESPINKTIELKLKDKDNILTMDEFVEQEKSDLSVITYYIFKNLL